MGNKGKKIVGFVAAITMMGATLASCGDTSYKGDKLPGYVSAAEVVSNGGFAVKKGDFVYFINGSENYTASNSYGDVVKGALMRISTQDLNSGAYDKAQTVVPSLFATPSIKAGIYIFGDYVYYATPTTDKNLDGEVENTWIEFKRAKLDGSAAPEKRFFRLSTSSSDSTYVTNYRFVTDGVDRNSDGKEDVFCLYEATVDGAKYLKSYNTATGDDVVLVKGAKSTFFYDQKELDNPTVYYTMAVQYNIDSANATTAQYDQLYKVSASARATVNKTNASYTVEGGRTYDFDEKYLKETDVDLSDYASYPYANLGTLVLDGVGRNSLDSRFNVGDKSTSDEVTGYNYTISRYENGGVYFTRKALTTAGATDSNLYYLADKDVNSEKTISGNQFAAADSIVDLVSNETTKASASALFEISKEGKHTYLYIADNKLVKATPGDKGVANTITLARNLSGATLLKTEGDYVYFYGTGTNGNNLSRINYKGDENANVKDAYNPLFADKEGYEEYQTVTLALVDWTDSWFKPEFLPETNVVLYPNAQSYGNGSSAYNYVYAARLDSTAKIEELNEKYEAVSDYLEEYSDNANSQALIKFFFRTDLTVSEESKGEYDDELFAEVSEKFGENGLTKEKDIIGFVGKMTEKDAEAINESWNNSLLKPKAEEEKEEGLSTGAIIAIVACAVVVLAAVITVPVVMAAKKKAAKKKEDEATVNAYKRKKIDTTDDKSIDVYADDEPTEETTEETVKEAPAEEPAEEVVEETTEEAVEEAVETVEEPVEETPAEEATEAPAETKENE